MPVTTRSQAAAAAAARRCRDLEPRRGVLTRSHVRTAAALRENVPLPAEASSSARSRKPRRAAAAVLARPPEKFKKAARCVQRRGNSTAGGRHISSLCDDLLLGIFLRLPSVATLVRVACTCPAWRRAVSSASDFRRRFRALHPAPLLGLFTSDASSIIAAARSPTFVPTLPHGSREDDDDLAAAVRGGDFSLTSLPSGGGWKVICNTCRFGNVLLFNKKDKSLAKLNPFTRQIERVVPDPLSRNMLGVNYCAGAVLSSEDGPRLMLVVNAGSKMKAAIFSMDTGGVCSATPWVDIPACPDRVDGGRLPFGFGVQLNGSVYYVHEDWGYTASIDTATMKLTVIELPQCVSRRSLNVGETQDGATCLVYSDGLDVGVLMHTRDAAADGTRKWVLDRVVSMDAELRRVLPAGQFDAQACVLYVLTVRDGYAYLSASVTLQDRYWLLSLCLGTMKLEKLFQGTYEGCKGIPYIMPWPRSLIGW